MPPIAAFTIVALSGISVAQIWCAPSTDTVPVTPLPPNAVFVAIPAVPSARAASPTPSVGVEMA